MDKTGEAGSVQLGFDGALATVRLCNPAKFNAMSRAMWLELKAAFEEIQRSTARCVLVTGEGSHFCAGGDISEYPSFRFDAARLAHFHEVEVWGGLSSMLACDVPVVAAISGNCMGAGVEIASCCDVRLAAVSAKFGAPIARLGFPMAPREAALVAQSLGANAARAMLLAAEIFPAQRLLECGFLTHIVADDALHAEAAQMTARMSALAPAAARMNKQTLRRLSAGSVFDSLTAGNTSDAEDPYAYADSHEHREGIAAFIQKRRPEF